MSHYFRTYCDGTKNGGKCDAGGYNKDSGTASGHWGLFGWVGASSTTLTSSPGIYGVTTSTSNSDYGDVAGESLKADWGKAIDDKGTCKDVPGRFIAPDGFVGDEDALKEAIKDWDSAQATGIVFLPAAGGRTGSDVYYVGDDGFYWSSSANGEFSAYSVGFDGSDVDPVLDCFRTLGYSVRLITDVK